MHAHRPPTPRDRQAGPRGTLPGRRAALAQGAALLLGPDPLQAQPAPVGDGERWYAAAAAMRTQALSWGDQPYGAVLYSTSQPCAACERAAARAGVARMVFGETPVDGGVPALR